jgi:hypothetical protein
LAQKAEPLSLPKTFVSLHSSFPLPSSRYLVRPVAFDLTSSGTALANNAAFGNSSVSWPAAASSTVSNIARIIATAQPASLCLSCRKQPAAEAKTFAAITDQEKWDITVVERTKIKAAKVSVVAPFAQLVLSQ